MSSVFCKHFYVVLVVFTSCCIRTVISMQRSTRHMACATQPCGEPVLALEEALLLSCSLMQEEATTKHSSQSPMETGCTASRHYAPKARPLLPKCPITTSVSIIITLAVTTMGQSMQSIPGTLPATVRRVHARAIAHPTSSSLRRASAKDVSE